MSEQFPVSRAKAKFDALTQNRKRLHEPQVPPRRGKSVRRRLKRKELQTVMKSLGCDLGRQIPCVTALIGRIQAGESIGFAGRKKVVGELLLAGKDENFICRTGPVWYHANSNHKSVRCHFLGKHETPFSCIVCLSSRDTQKKGEIMIGHKDLVFTKALSKE